MRGILNGLVFFFCVINSSLFLFGADLIENFEGGNALGWRPTGGKWSVEDDKGNKVYTESEECGNCISLFDEDEFDDFTFKFRLRNNIGTNRISGVFRYQDTNSYYQINIGNNVGGLILYKLYSGPSGSLSSLTLRSYGFTYEQNRWYWLKVECKGNEIRAKVWPDGSKEVPEWQIEETDSNYASGKVGLQCTDYSKASFDDVEVKALKKTGVK